MATQVTLNSGSVDSAAGLKLRTNGTTEAVDISTGQVVTFAKDAVVNGLTVGKGAGAVATNTAVGASALAAPSTTGGSNIAVGYQSLGYNSAGVTGAENVGIGYQSLGALTSGSNNIAVADYALRYTTTGGNNVAVGMQALQSNTTASNNTAVGYQAGYSNTTGQYNTILGRQAGFSLTTGDSNTMVGQAAGYSLTTGSYNTFVGSNSVTNSSGQAMTTGSKNSILGNFSGNQGGLDIRTASNYVVLSDGDGNPRGIFDTNGAYMVGTFSADIIGANSNGMTYRPASNSFSVNAVSGSGVNFGRSTTTGTIVNFFYNAAVKGTISTDGSTTSYNTSSDYRLKEISGALTGYKERIMALQPKQGAWISDGSEFRGFLAHEFAVQYPKSVNGEKDAVDENGAPIYQGMQAGGSETIADLVAYIHELETRLSILENKL